MTKDSLHIWVVGLICVLFAVSALGYFVAPGRMLAVVGIAADPHSAFLVRTLAAAFVALIPITWSVRRRQDSPTYRAVVLGLVIYLALGSVVDLHAWAVGLVGPAAIPSAVFRVGLGGLLLWLGFSQGR